METKSPENMHISENLYAFDKSILANFPIPVKVQEVRF